MPPEEALASPAWAMPFRTGESAAALCADPDFQTDAIDLAVSFDGEKNVLSICDSPAFPELHRLWAQRSEMPRELLLALVEMECGGLLQGLENAVRRSLKVEGLAPESPAPGAARLALRTGDIRFSLDAAPAVVEAFGQPRFLDLSHDAVRSLTLDAEAEYAVFAMDDAEISSIAAGDAVLLPELESGETRFVVDGRFSAGPDGVLPWRDDGRVRAVSASACTISLGELFDAAEGSGLPPAPPPARLRLVRGAATLAEGRVEKLAGADALAVEAAGA